MPVVRPDEDCPAVPADRSGRPSVPAAYPPAVSGAARRQPRPAGHLYEPFRQSAGSGQRGHTAGAGGHAGAAEAVKQTEQGAYLNLDPDKTKKIIASVEEETTKLENLGKNAIIITSPIVRMYFKKLTEDYFKDLIVVSYNEIDSNVELQSVGMVTIQ